MTYGPPANLETFDRWVAERLLNPASAIFREGNLLLREEAALTDPTPYHAVLTAIAGGATRRSEIAGLLGRPVTGVGHLLEGLEQVGLITRLEDALRQKRGAYRLTDPLIRLHSLVIERNEGALVRGLGARVWTANADTVASMICGPHFQDLAREWCVSHAQAETLGGEPNRVLPAVAPCRTHGQCHELDVVVIDHPANQHRRVVAIGEAKATDASMDQAQLRRLEHLRDLLPATLVPAPARLLLFSRSGFAPELRREAATRDDVELVDLDRLYNGT